MRLALYQPDIPQNAGAMMRTAACLGVAVDVIEPCGFVLGDRGLRRAAMDYLDGVDLSPPFLVGDIHGGAPARRGGPARPPVDAG